MDILVNLPLFLFVIHKFQTGSAPRCCVVTAPLVAAFFLFSVTTSIAGLKAYQRQINFNLCFVSVLLHNAMPNKGTSVRDVWKRLNEIT